MGVSAVTTAVICPFAVTTRITATDHTSALAVFPPPCAALRFVDGDRYEWPHSGDVWERHGEHWKPAPDDGSGWLTDEEVRTLLHRAATQQDTGHRFVPIKPYRTSLPGTRLHSAADLESLMPKCAQHVAQYVQQHTGSGRLVPLRDLVAKHDEDFAHDIPATLTIPELREVVHMILESHAQAEASYDAVAGRLYARYELEPLDGRHAGHRMGKECFHTFVLSTTTPQL
jgi:hypothetical protein